MRYPFVRWAFVFACCYFLIGSAGATSVERLSFEELVDHSVLIVSGHVTRTWADWDSEHQFIWTHYEMAVSAVHKGTPGSTVTVSEPGGVVGDRGMTIADTVSYQTGEEVLVFLTRVPNGNLRTTGWSQGKYTEDAKGILHAASSLRPGTSIPTLEGMSAGELHNLVSARLRQQQKTQAVTR